MIRVTISLEQAEAIKELILSSPKLNWNTENSIAFSALSMKIKWAKKRQLKEKQNEKVQIVRGDAS